MFYAIAKKKIDLRDFKIVHMVEDIESLNQRALRGELEATAVSVHAYAYLADHYAIMRSGASIGEKYGPIVVARPDFEKKKRGQSPFRPYAGRKSRFPARSPRPLWCFDFSRKNFLMSLFLSIKFWITSNQEEQMRVLSSMKGKSLMSRKAYEK